MYTPAPQQYQAAEMPQGQPMPVPQEKPPAPIWPTAGRGRSGQRYRGLMADGVLHALIFSWEYSSISSWE